MASSSVEGCIAKLTLADLDDDGGLQQLDNIPCETVRSELEFMAVGRLLTEKLIRFPYFRDTIAAIWRPTMGMNVKELQPKLYLFRFFHEGDMARIMDDGPWSYEQSLLLLRRLSPEEDPETVNITHTEFWVQIHGLPNGFKSDSVLQAIGNFIGILVKTDDRNFDGSLRVFFRIRVSIDVSKPLKKGMRLRKDSGEWSAIQFRYERLPTFCFVCGLIGHGEKFCSKALLESCNQIEKPFGPSLRASGRGQGIVVRQRWLAPETVAERKLWIAPGLVSSSDSSPTSGKNFEASPSVLTRTAPALVPMQKGDSFSSPRSKDEVSTPYVDPSLSEHGEVVTVIDQKRRRKEATVETSDVKTDSMDLDASRSKNVQLAGSGSS